MAAICFREYEQTRLLSGPDHSSPEFDPQSPDTGEISTPEWTFEAGGRRNIFHLVAIDEQAQSISGWCRCLSVSGPLRLDGAFGLRFNPALEFTSRTLLLWSRPRIERDGRRRTTATLACRASAELAIAVCALAMRLAPCGVLARFHSGDTHFRRIGWPPETICDFQDGTAVAEWRPSRDILNRMANRNRLDLRRVLQSVETVRF